MEGVAVTLPRNPSDIIDFSFSAALNPGIVILFLFLIHSGIEVVTAPAKNRQMMVELVHWLGLSVVHATLS